MYVFEQKYEKYQNFCLKTFRFLVVKFSIYLKRRVFVMFFRINITNHSFIIYILLIEKIGKYITHVLAMIL